MTCINKQTRLLKMHIHNPIMIYIKYGAAKYDSDSGKLYIYTTIKCSNMDSNAIPTEESRGNCIILRKGN